MFASPWKTNAVLLIVCCFIASVTTTVQPFSLPVPVHGEHLLSPREAMKNNLKRSFECFQTYSPKMHVLSKELKIAESKCLDTFTGSLLRGQTAAHRTDLTDSEVFFCNNFGGCGNPKNSRDFFRCNDCIANTGTNSTQWIGLNAQDGVQLVEISYDVIEYDRKRCNNLASTVFVWENLKLQADLDTCISGISRSNGQNQTSAKTPLDQLKVKVNVRLRN